MKLSTISEKGSWYKGNTHTHSTVSDGLMTLDEVKRDYKDRGYSFIVMTDHMIYFNSEKLNDNDFIVIPGIETHVTKPNYNDHHIVGIFDPEDGKVPYSHNEIIDTFNWSGDFNDTEPLQKTIDELKERGNLCIYAHPVYNRVFPEQLLKLDGFFALEIWNHESVYWSSCGEAIYHWDYLLRNKRKVWGVASDDRHQKDVRYSGGFVMVKAPSLSVKDITKALKEGSFYSSTGPEIYDFYIENGIAYAKTSDVYSMSFICYEPHGRVYIPQNGNETMNEYEHNVREGVSYIRLEITDLQGRKAWSNPIFL